MLEHPTNQLCRSGPLTWCTPPHTTRRTLGCGRCFHYTLCSSQCAGCQCQGRQGKGRLWVACRYDAMAYALSIIPNLAAPCLHSLHCPAHPAKHPLPYHRKVEYPMIRLCKSGHWISCTPPGTPGCTLDHGCCCRCRLCSLRYAGWQSQG